MRRVRGSGFFRAHRERDARECLCRKGSQPWRVPQRAHRLAAAKPWPSPHRLEPFREEFVVRTGRGDPKTFRSHPKRISTASELSWSASKEEARENSCVRV